MKTWSSPATRHTPRIVPLKIQDLLRQIAEGRERLAQPVELELAPLGYSPQAAAPRHAKSKIFGAGLSKQGI